MDMNKFEEQIHNSAQRIKRRSNAEVKVGPSPLGVPRPSFGWVKVAVAAVAGLVVGIFVPYAVQVSGEVSLPPVSVVRVVDTVFRDCVFRDTVYVPSQVTPAVHLAATNGNREEYAERRDTAGTDTVGKCILDDGIDYSLLASF
jgi:hypothetical protein